MLELDLDAWRLGSRRRGNISRCFEAWKGGNRMTLDKLDVTGDGAAPHAGRRTVRHNHKDAVVTLLAQPF